MGQIAPALFVGEVSKREVKFFENFSLGKRNDHILQKICETVTIIKVLSPPIYASDNLLSNQKIKNYKEKYCFLFISPENSPKRKMKWMIVFLLGSILSVMARPWIGPSHDFGLVPNGPRIRLHKHHDDIMWNPLYQKDLYEIFNYLAGKKDMGQRKSATKRALSALSRWKPIGAGSGKVKTSARGPSKAPMISMVPDTNYMSAESAEALRVMGHPLRWGKRR